MVYYRRRSNVVGWLAFFGIGAGVFVGLIIALQFLKQRQERIDQNAADDASKAHAKLADPKANVWNEVARYYKEKGLGFTKIGINLAENVRSSKDTKKEFVVARVQHRGNARREDDEDPPAVDEVYVIEILHDRPAGKEERTTLKFTKIEWEKWETARERFGFDEEVTKKLEGSSS
jgi:hypothetical protein